MTASRRTTVYGVDVSTEEGLDAILGPIPADEGWGPPPVLAEALIPVGALVEYEAQCRAGRRRGTELDAVQIAACHEANARDLLAQGAVQGAADEIRRAAVVLARAAQGRAA